MPDRSQVRNFAAGPSPLPTSVLHKAAEGLLNYNETGMGICELSHRGKDFKAVCESAEASIRELLQVPSDYSILFTQGGATAQFSSTFLNILAYHRIKQSSTSAKDYKPPNVDYIITGSWSSKAYAEAQRLSIPSTPDSQPLAKPRIAATTKPTKFTTLPKNAEYDFSKEDCAMVYYCENETINGIEYPLTEEEGGGEFSFPWDKIPEGVPVIGDYSSSFISRPIKNLDKHAIIVAGAQKNLGPAGVTVVIVKNQYLVDTTEAMKLGNIPNIPIQNEYKILADNQSLYNTPPVFAIYISKLVLDYLKDEGGIKKLEDTNREKARVLYECLDEAEKEGKLRCVVREKKARSWMNVPFNMIGEGNDELFLKGAEEKGFRQLKGHRSVGGVRASLYNAVSLESVQALCDYIRQFSPKKSDIQIAS